MKTNLNDVVSAKAGSNLVLTALLFLFLLINNLFSQTTDTLIISADPPGNLNNVINNDTTSSGERADHVYLLENNEQTNSIYYLTEPITAKDLILVGKNNPGTNFPPVIAPYINEDDTSVETFIEIEKGGVINLKNLYLLGTRTDNTSVTQYAVSAEGDSVTFKIDHCIFENFGSTGTPNILNTWDATGNDIFVTNSLFRNNQSNSPTCPGISWAGPDVVAIDTAIFKNNTFFILGGNITGSGTDIGYLEFDHNTIFMQTKFSPFSIREQSNSIVRNNIFFSVYSAGYDSFHVFDQDIWSSPTWGLPAVVMLDTLVELKKAPFFLTEADRKIIYNNNVYYWPQKIVDNFDTLNSNPDYQIVGGRIYAPVWASAKIPELLTDREKWPGIDIYTNNDSLDPGFDTGLVNAAVDSMVRFVRYLWKNGGNGTGSRPFVYLSDPDNVFEGVEEDWDEIQGYPVRENFRYTNEYMKTAGTDGLPLGDLNWFPEQMVSVDEKTNLLSESFSLSQNYPNPFNPATRIEYQVSSNENVTLKVYDVLGREIATLVNEQKTPGNYKVTFDAGALASGIYIYKLQAGGYSVAKKMILLK